MTTVRLPRLADGKASIRLVYLDDHTQQVIGFDQHEWATEYRSVSLDTEKLIELVPTLHIATADHRPTCYSLTIQTTGGRKLETTIQVPDSNNVIELDVLISAARVYPESMKAIFLGGALVEIVDSIPDTEVPGVIYFMTE